ncbi:mycofactocin oligosaccharide methyltransferase MftM [Tsukamurella tyrosinosolvens]|uniref:mycofactocin oligosaccharide methyltransferase MftM n=1 Tax=Tsukamurella tyrosinosolvens TaxID=57704 RepID=UPI000C7EAD58|nr:mycofactocin oligosaccharide methyltransferase MftM [Tsukamurella tyrosinosolvens]AUN41664.1 SAM-dependent methyltransferase [Tsukamurella tyrosinosolvens]
MIDVLAPQRPGTWSDGTVTVSRSGRPDGALLAVERAGGRVHLRHRLRPEHLRDSLAARLAAIAAPPTVDEFERLVVGAVRSTVDVPHEAWLTYYRNSLADLESGCTPFAPVHERAEELLVGESLLDLGSCFGFFALRAARREWRVTASDLCPGTMALLARVAPDLGAPLRTVAGDAAATGLPDGYADTVTALHLLEHVPPAAGRAILAEAVRLARRRVIVAVPYEDEPDARYGHVRTFTATTLRELGAATGLAFAVTEHHGGWLVVDR